MDNAATRKETDAMTRPTSEAVYMMVEGTCCEVASVGSHVHHPEAASAVNHKSVMQSVVRSMLRLKSEEAADGRQ